MPFLKAHSAEIILVLIALVALQSLFLLAMSARLSRTAKLVRSLLSGPNGDDLEAMLRGCLEESERSRGRSDQLDDRLNAFALQMRGCVQQIGLVRFDAFGDVSGDQSFSIALLDGNGNGAIITGLFGRHDSRCYGKPVIGGRTEQALSDEEEVALQRALGGGLSALDTGDKLTVAGPKGRLKRA